MTSPSAAASWIPRVAAAALASFDSTMTFIGLTDGKRSGPEYLPLNWRRPDNLPGYFSINTASGERSDIAAGAQGLDLVSLAAYVWNEKQSASASRLAHHLGIEVLDGQEATLVCESCIRDARQCAKVGGSVAAAGRHTMHLLDDQSATEEQP